MRALAAGTVFRGVPKAQQDQCSFACRRGGKHLATVRGNRGFTMTGICWCRRAPPDIAACCVRAMP